MDIVCLGCLKTLGIVADPKASKSLYQQELDLLRLKLDGHCPNCNRPLYKTRPTKLKGLIVTVRKIAQ